MTTAVGSVTSAYTDYNNVYGTAADYTGNYSDTSNSLFSNPYSYGYYGPSSSQVQNYYDMNNQYMSYSNKNSAQQLTLKDQCTSLAQVISEGQEDAILTEYNELVSTLASQPQYQNCNEQELKAVAKQIFQNTTGISLNDAINQNCSGNFATGLKQGFFLGNADSISKEQLISEINGTPMKGGASKVIGNIIGAIGGIICLGLPALFGEHG